MPDLESQLRSALKRKCAPENLADDVMARISSQPALKPGWWSRAGRLVRVPRMAWAMAGALALALIVGGIVAHHRAELDRSRGEAAKAQLKEALRIASTKLNGTWKKAVEPVRRTPPS